MLLALVTKNFKPVIEMIRELKAEAGKEKLQAPQEDNSDLKKEIEDFIGDRLLNAYKEKEKSVRSGLLEEISTQVKEKFINEEKAIDENKVSSIFKKLSAQIVRNDILDNGVRIDGRKTNEVRQIEIETGFLPQVHGSALFTRGETQAIVVATLGSSKDKQLVENLDPGIKEEAYATLQLPSIFCRRNWPPKSSRTQRNWSRKTCMACY